MKFDGERVIEIDRKAEEVTIPVTATRVCEIACFLGSITSLDFENTQITIIEKHAFANCHSLRNVTFSRCLKEISEGAFERCNNLEHISFPPYSKLQNIGRKAFRYCTELEPFDFPPLLEFVGDFAFQACRRMKIIDLRNTKVRYIGKHRIHNDCTEVYLPPTMRVSCIIGSNIEFANIESHPVVKRDECGYYNANGTIFGGFKGSKRHAIIRRGVERISHSCFCYPNIVSVTIPSSVTEICEYAFNEPGYLRFINFLKDSRLEVIHECAFYCVPIRKINFPKSLKIIKEDAFAHCKSLERVVFPQDSQLEKIDAAFYDVAIKHLSLLHSVREIVCVSNGMESLKSISVSNDLYQSNEEGNAIFSKDGSELVCVIKALKQFEIQDGVRVIKKRAFYSSSIKSIIIPSSVEVIEEEAFDFSSIRNIEFSSGSRLKSLAFNALFDINTLIINNENFFTMENGVVMSLSPRGIVYVPKELTEFEIPPGVEVIYSCALSGS